MPNPASLRSSPWLCLPVALLLAQCASTSSGASRAEAARSTARTYKGLTLEEWAEIPWSGSGRLTDGSGKITFERDGSRAVEALTAFARDSRQALAVLHRFATDLDEDLRDEAAEAIVALAFSQEDNQRAAMDATMDLLSNGDSLTCQSVLQEILNLLGDEPSDWGRFGREREGRLAARIEFLLYAREDDGLETALEGIRILAQRSESHERRFRELLAASAARFRAPDSANELDDFAKDLVGPREDRCRLPELALLAARAAVELEPQEPGYLGTLAFAHWRAGDREEALSASRQAVQAASTEGWREDKVKRLQQELELLSQEESWRQKPPKPR